MCEPCHAGRVDRSTKLDNIATWFGISHERGADGSAAFLPEAADGFAVEIDAQAHGAGGTAAAAHCPESLSIIRLKAGRLVILAV